MIRRPPRSTRTDTLFPTRRSSDLARAEHRGALAVGVAHALVHDAIRTLLMQVSAKRLAGGIAVRGVEGRAFIAQAANIVEHGVQVDSVAAQAESLPRVWGVRPEAGSVMARPRNRQLEGACTVERPATAVLTQALLGSEGG